MHPYYEKIIAYAAGCANGFFYRVSGEKRNILRFSFCIGKTETAAGPGDGVQGPQWCA